MRKFNRKHTHKYRKPIASMYVSFNTRDIVYECICGKRSIERETRIFSDAFPIPTNHLITFKELNKIANQ